MSDYGLSDEFLRAMEQGPPSRITVYLHSQGPNAEGFGDNEVPVISDADNIRTQCGRLLALGREIVFDPNGDFYTRTRLFAVFGDADRQYKCELPDVQLYRLLENCLDVEEGFIKTEEEHIGWLRIWIECRAGGWDVDGDS